jgi:hypothetical protein
MNISRDRERAEQQDVRLLATAYCAQATDYHALTLEGPAEFAGGNLADITHALPREEWHALRDGWILQRGRQAMEEMYKEARTQEGFLAQRIALRAGVPKGVFKRVVGEEWLTRKATLPTVQETLLEVIERMVQTNIPLAQFTLPHIYATARLPFRAHCPPWLSQARREAYFKLAQNQRVSPPPPPSGEHIHLIPGGWVDLDSSSWDLRPAGGHILKRERLRGDLATLAWSLLREELREGELALSTLSAHYRGFQEAGRVLGTNIPEVRSATLETLQRAWASCEGTHISRIRARTGLLSIFEALLKLSTTDPALDSQELQSMVNWLETMLVFPHEQSDGAFLSESEFNELLTCCLMDMKTGIAFTENGPDLTKLSTRQNAEVSATCVVQWAVALMILLGSRSERASSS